MKSNVSQMDRGIRMATGAALILGVLTNPFSPAWMSLLAAYAVLTSIVSWEPVYAIARLATHGSTSPKVTLGRRDFALEP